MDKPKCTQCQFYFVTWNVKQPHGCKAFGFESEKIPNLIVFLESKKNCTLYQKKEIKRPLKPIA